MSGRSLAADAWDRILDVNLKAMWLTCKHVVPVMREQGSGAIVNISSIAAVAGVGNLTAYKISKAGVNALTQSLAVTNARFGIRANAIMPGLIDTPMSSYDFPGWGDPGPGQWVTVYGMQSHAYMVVAGLRFDTSASKGGGSRWTTEQRSPAGYVAVHPSGL